MKKLFQPALQCAALLLGCLLAGAPKAHAQAVTHSPVGTWDCTISGSEIGLCILTFSEDFTFLGDQFLRPNPSRQPSAPDFNPRFPDGTVPERGDTGGGTTNSSSSSTHTNFVGGTTMSGRWGYDFNGKTIGLLDQITATIELVEQSVTNIVNGTNVVSTTNVYQQVLHTNSVGFRGTVVEGKRITLTSFSPHGPATFRGTPSIPLVDLTGEFYASGKRAKTPFFEFLTATPSGELPNEYVLDGQGPGYIYSGFAILSRQKRIAVYTQTANLPEVITVYTGPFNLTTRRGSLIGRDSDGKSYTYKLVHQ